jgi:hypothetical protein
MPSIIEGYNYDIFISYRQKDYEEGGSEKVRGRWGRLLIEELKQVN